MRWSFPYPSHASRGLICPVTRFSVCEPTMTTFPSTDALGEYRLGRLWVPPQDLHLTKNKLLLCVLMSALCAFVRANQGISPLRFRESFTPSRLRSSSSSRRSTSAVSVFTDSAVCRLFVKILFPKSYSSLRGVTEASPPFFRTAKRAAIGFRYCSRARELANQDRITCTVRVDCDERGKSSRVWQFMELHPRKTFVKYVYLSETEVFCIRTGVNPNRVGTKVHKSDPGASRQ